MSDRDSLDRNSLEPDFVLVNPDEPDVNPHVWKETEGGRKGYYTGEPRKKKVHRRVVHSGGQAEMPKENAPEGTNASDVSDMPAMSASSRGSAPQGSSSPYVTKRFLVLALIITVVISTALGAVVGSLMGGRGGSYSNLTSDSSLSEATGSKLTVQEIYKKNADAVVEITTEVQTKSVFGNSVSQGAGSGVIVNKKGYIATNYHVIDGAKKISVRLRNGKSKSASVVGYDESNDIAVLKISGSGYTAAKIGKSSNVQVGDLAVAIGNPLGQLGGTTTAGIISALDRQLTLDDKKLTLLQTDTAINPGNSGGGLFNGRGELIGIVVAKGSGTGIEGLGFAIPIDTAAPIIDDIIDNGTVVEKPAAGITVVNVTEDNKDEFKVDKTGVYIYQVYGNHAKKAGLKAGDRIVKVDGKKVSTNTQVVQQVQTHKVGDTLSITIERNGKQKTVKFKLEKASQFEDQENQLKQEQQQQEQQGQ
ncbi:MAG: trypsin-like peptidase domain-containing protein [Eubacteriales bacterium]|nr:trypsin-like peptidase domain-containing protein [Eubacteriales bacterium]